LTRGAALPAALFAIAITSAMAVGGVYAGRRHAAGSRDAGAAATLRPRVERAAIDAFINWDSVSRAQQPVGQSVMLDSTQSQRVWITRTSDLGYLIVAEGTDGIGHGLHDRIGLSVVVLGGRPGLAFPRAWSLLP